jgi:hypothetical protein
MVKSKPDDYEAVRTVVATLEPFDINDQERILRWAREKLGLAASNPPAAPNPETRPARNAGNESASATPATATNIRSFIDSKKPQSDIQFAAAVAYYYRFDAPEPQRKEAIVATDLQEACRQTGRDRLHNPGQTLINAHHYGYLDKGTERGTYVINTVGENLIAMALPEGEKVGSAATTRRKSGPKAKGAKRGDDDRGDDRTTGGHHRSGSA